MAKVIFTAFSFQDGVKVSKANRAIIFKIILQIFIIFYKITDIYIIQHILRLDGYFIIFECVCIYAIYIYLLTELISFYLNFRSDFILNIYIFVLLIFLVCFYGLFILTMLGLMLLLIYLGSFKINLWNLLFFLECIISYFMWILCSFCWVWIFSRNTTEILF